MKLKPDYYVPAIRDIDFQVLKDRGIRLLLLDVDNTIVPFKEALPDERVRLWIEEGRKQGLDFTLVSNAYPRRVEVIGKALNVSYVYMAKKPLPVGVRESLKKNEAGPEEAIMVGDQIFTDVLAARLAGVPSILVDPLTKSDFFMTKIYRLLEYFVKGRLSHEEMKK